MSPNLTSYVALYGAGVATLSLFWNFWRDYRARPRIAVKIRARENYEEDGFGAIMFELRNRGGKPTTVEEIKLVKRSPGVWGLLGQYEYSENTSVASCKTVKLPVVLKPGDVWKGFSAITKERSTLCGPDKNDLIEKGQLLYRVKCAHTNRMLSGRIRQEPLSEL